MVVNKDMLDRNRLWAEDVLIIVCGPLVSLTNGQVLPSGLRATSGVRYRKLNCSMLSSIYIIILIKAQVQLSIHSIAIPATEGA